MKKNLFFLIVAASLLAGCKSGKEESAAIPQPKNIIMMIGDGMGLEQISCAWVANKGTLNIDQMPVVGFQRTYSANSLITDSAAGGTALATGSKTDNGHVGVTPDGQDFETLMDKARKAGKRTGVAVTCSLTDATPSDFCCHNEDRDDGYDLSADYVDSDVDFIAGGGLRFWSNRPDGRDLNADFIAKGYTTCTDAESLLGAEKLPVAASIADFNLPVAAERGDLFRKITAKAIEMLSKDNDNGFFLMIEGSCIDDWCHENDIDRAVGEMLDFDRTLGDVLEWAKADGNTLVVVTADHATGSLTLQGGNLETGEIEVNFATDSHNGIAVPYYVFGPGSENFGGILENTDIARITEQLL